MTRPTPLILCGNQIKLRLEQERQETGTPVHIDWLRFTIKTKNAPLPAAEVLFPKPKISTLENPLSRHEEEMGLSYAEQRHARLLRVLMDLPDPDFAVSAQARELGNQVCAILGGDFTLDPELKKGHDFYRFRWSITRAEQEVGWIGFLASGESPRQIAQAQTIHCNLYGGACTFAKSGWRESMADLVADHDAVITRVDLALDFFDGISGGLDRIRDDWHAGLMDCYGKRPKANTVGPWVDGGRGRSFYWGSKEAGKQTNAYEKGVQLFGEKDATSWERVELRFGNKLRFLDPEILTRPADFFAGASDWHAAILREHGPALVTPESIPCEKPAPTYWETLPEVQDEIARQQRAELIVRAEVVRVYRWLRDTAGPSLTFAMEHLGFDQLAELMFNHKRPGRLQKFMPSEIKRASEKAFNHVNKAPRNRATGFVASLAH